MTRNSSLLRFLEKSVNFGWKVQKSELNVQKPKPGIIFG